MMCGSALLEAVAALATASLILASAATQGLQSATAVTEARSVSSALTLARNVLDRALAAPCAPTSYAAAMCAEPYRCNVAAQTLGQRVRPDGTVTVVRLTVDILLHRDGEEDRRLAQLVTIGAQPAACA
jgi:hypothetical protein